MARLVARIIAIVLVCVGVYVLGFLPYALFVSHHSSVVAQHRLDRTLVGGLKTSKISTSSDAAIPVVDWPKRVPPGTPIAKLTIPSAGVFGDVIVEGAQKVQLEEGPGHYIESAMPGDPGNIALAGHRTTWLHPFYNLPSVKIGDKIVLMVGSHKWVYRAIDRVVVSPTDVSVLDPLPGWYITLTTCTPLYSAADRFVVRGVLAKEATLAVNSTSSPSATSTVRVVSLPSSRAVLPSVPLILLPVWLVVAACCVVATFLLRKRPLVLRALLVLAAGTAAFESYGVALNLLPRTW
ncbi:sortase [Ferrimicrobium sp.]|uniref:sortase n=1 Tax=Ferrimicrobium sp. TaxID=2926050 RepID=UPI0026148F96|nr:sortase [Ferrimicrobium sp.]